MRPLHSGWWIAALIAAVGTLFLSVPSSSPGVGPSNPTPGGSPAPTTASKLLQLEQRERKADTTFWEPEVLARQYGGAVEHLWDDLNASTNRLELLAGWALNEITLQPAGPDVPLGPGLHQREGTGSSIPRPRQEWSTWLRAQATQGWQLSVVEFRQIAFDPPVDGAPPRSRYAFAFQAERWHPGAPARAQWEGECWISWQTNRTLGQNPEPDSISVIHWRSVQCDQPNPFPQVFEAALPSDAAHPIVDPLMVQDLDGDGVVEILLPGANQLHRLGAGGKWSSQPLLPTPPQQPLGALLLDLDHDGLADLLIATPEGLSVYRGQRGATFTGTPANIWKAPSPLQGPTVITAGDIHHNGRLELFLGQYRVPSLGQILKPAYHNADDGYPSYLLRQGDNGTFMDVTDTVVGGLARHRRVFSASFVDLDSDNALDLVVVSDFKGLDWYRNNGQGKWVNATVGSSIETHAFGMSHAVTDFNNDGIPDLLMIGMTSPTVSRLDHLKLWRPHPGLDPDRTLRTRMTAGNRLYLGRSGAQFEDRPTPASLARSGWSWGVAAADFDNDGWEDVYITNGNESNRSVREFEPLFWTHDLFIDRTVDDDAATAYLTTSFARTRGAGFSYAGYERNRLLLSQRGNHFPDVAGALGLGFQTDCRNVVAADIDGDGRQDLVLTTEEIWPTRRRMLRVFKNALGSRQHWIGLSFDRSPGAMDPLGTRATLTVNGRRSLRVLLSGDSYRSQRPASMHWGLGDETRVESVEVVWPDGSHSMLDHPQSDRLHALIPPLDRRK